MRYEASTEAAQAFCQAYSRWMDISSVTDIHAFDKLDSLYAESDLTVDDEFTMYFDGDYKTSVDSHELKLYKDNIKYYRV